MKKLLKTIVCLTIAASLCIMSCGVVFAGEGDSSDVSLEDLLALLSQLTGEEETGEDIEEIAEITEEAGDLTTLTIGSFSIDIPTDWYENADEDEESGTFTYYASDYTVWATLTYVDEISEDEKLDLSDPSQEQAITEILGATGDIADVSHVTVDGVDALQMSISFGDEDASLETYSLIIPFESEMLMVGVSGFGDHAADFEACAGSIVIDPSAAPAPPANTGSAATAEGIDATAVDEIVLVDDENVTVTVKSFDDTDDYYALTSKIFLQNKTDLNLYYTVDDVSVNGYMCDPWWGESVSAGHKSNSEMHFRKADVDKIGIENFHDIEFRLTVRDDDDYSADYLVDETFIIYPYGLDVPEQADPEFADDAIVMADTDEFTMILTGFSEDDYYVYGHVFLENKTDKEVEFKVAGSSTVNGYEINPYFYKDVMPGKKMLTDMTWYISDLDDNDIETIEDMELELEINDANDWSADSYYEDVIYITFE